MGVRTFSIYIGMCASVLRTTAALCCSGQLLADGGMVHLLLSWAGTANCHNTLTDTMQEPHLLLIWATSTCAAAVGHQCETSQPLSVMSGCSNHA